MSGGMTRRRFVWLGLIGTLEVASLGCGTILHPERRGQPAGQLDWGVVALDAVGLFFFFVPGVIAFAVDFSNGTIYLPSGESAAHYHASADRSMGELFSIHMAEAKVTPEAIEKTIALETGRQIRLIPGAYRTKQLERLEQFWTTRAQFEIG